MGNYKIWANPSLGGTTKNHLKECLNRPNEFSRPFLKNVFIIMYIYFDVFQLHALVYGFNFFIEFNKGENHNKFIFLITF
jgi:hypothetical protein